MTAAILITQEDAKAKCEGAFRLETQAQMAYLLLGKAIYEIQEKRLWELAGYESWHEFAMEFRELSDSSLKKLRDIYVVFVLKHGYKDKVLAEAGGWTKLYEITTRATTKKELDDWLDRAAHVGRAGLIKELIEAKTGVQQRSCKHPEAYTIRVCPDCHDRWRAE